jgi:peptide-methionine (R)-S-oxide reductase
MKRRFLLQALLFLPLAAGPFRLLAAARTDADIQAIRDGWRHFLPPGFQPPPPGSTVSWSDEQWRKKLSDMQYEILRREGTEPSFTSPLNDEKRAGVFVCSGCELPLFSSEMMFDSGTGWPSFFTFIPGALNTKRDFKLIWPRTEYHCARCGGHQGHVFEDGPPPTGQRWCNNGVALRFLAAS